MTTTDFGHYPANAKELPRRESPLLHQYTNTDPRLMVDKHAGVITTDPTYKAPTSVR
jgi:hypothetical protein